MTLYDWARRWSISLAAVRELQQLFGAHDDGQPPAPGDGESEAAVQNRLRLTASQQGARLWRNNVGAGWMDDGSFVRWGLANDSQKMNKRFKSSDLIGIRPVRIEHHHVGLIIGQFVAREAKPADWVYRGTEREQAQLAFIELINSLGGDAQFANRGDDV